MEISPEINTESDYCHYFFVRGGLNGRESPPLNSINRKLSKHRAIDENFQIILRKLSSAQSNRVHFHPENANNSLGCTDI